LYAVTPFRAMVAHRHPAVSLVPLDGESASLLRPVAEGPFRAILDWYRANGVRACVSSFRPVETPALVLYPQGAEMAREAEASREAGDLPGPLAGLIQEYVDQKFSGGEDLKGTLHLNASCPLLRRLAERPPNGESLGFVLTLLHQVARLFAGRMLSASDAVDAFREMTRSVEGLLHS
jgi:hypothetical protein